jgi:uncharacterized Fe-S cluster protein YjdI/CDGSH-type Zn-finger protein
MARRTYENQTIRVVWDSTLCIHEGTCLREGAGVFDVGRRPWVDLDRADVDTVVAAVEGCPSGALRYERLDGGPEERSRVPTTVVPLPRGPLAVRGDLRILDSDGGAFLVGPRATLCRCGASANQPFCDLSHRRVRFTDSPRAPRDDAESPADVGPGPG